MLMLFDKGSEIIFAHKPIFLLLSFPVDTASGQKKRFKKPLKWLSADDTGSTNARYGWF